MFKFFRKYNKIILVVGGSLLMVVFLIGPALQQIGMGDPRDEVQGYVGDEEITLGQLNQARAQMDIIRRLNPRAAMTRLPILRDGSIAENGELRYLLMQKAAEQMGIYAGISEAQQVLNAWGVSQGQLDDLQQTNRVSPEQVYAIMRQFMAVVKWQDLMVGGQLASVEPLGFVPGFTSEARLRQIATQMFSAISLRAIPLPAEYFVDESYQPSPADIESHYQQYRSNFPGTARPFGFGYRQPNKLQLEWLTFDITPLIEQVDIDRIDALDAYQQDPQRFLTQDQMPTADEQAEVPPFDEVYEQVVRTLKREAAEQRINEAMRWASAQLSSARGTLERGSLGYYDLPEDYQPLDYEMLAAQIQQRFNVPVRYQRIEDRWLTAMEIFEIEGLGRSWTDLRLGARSQMLPLIQYLQYLRELQDTPQQVPAPLRLQIDVTGSPLSDAQGNQYLFRVIGLKDDAPAELEEVREQIIEDLRLAQAFDRVRNQLAPQYLDMAVNQGMTSVVDRLNQELGLGETQNETTDEPQNDEAASETMNQDAADDDTQDQPELQIVPMGPFSKRAMTRQGEFAVPQLPRVGQSQTFVDEAYELANRVSESGGLEQAVATARFSTIALPEQLTVYLVQLTERQPLTITRYWNMLKNRPGMFTGQSQLAELQAFQEVRELPIEENPFSMESLIEMTGYVWEIDPEEDEPDASDAALTTETDEPTPESDADTAE